MPRKKQITFWACDFETTVWGEKVEQEKGKKQDSTEVWSAADVALYDNTETVTITHSIRDFLNRFLTMKGNNILYFHNLAFDGSFIIDFLLKEGWRWVHCKDKEMKSKEFQTCISDMGSWYWVKLKWNKTFLEIRNSLKLMPSSLKNIGKSFDTKHQKLDMNYEGERYAYCEITESEKKSEAVVWIVQFRYLKEDVMPMFRSIHYGLIITATAISTAVSAATKLLSWHPFFILVLSAVLYFGIYLLVLTIGKEPLVIELEDKFLGRFIKKWKKQND